MGLTVGVGEGGIGDRVTDAEATGVGAPGRGGVREKKTAAIPASNPMMMKNPSAFFITNASRYNFTNNSLFFSYVKPSFKKALRNRGSLTISH